MLQQDIWRTAGADRARQIDRAADRRPQVLKDVLAVMAAAVQRSYRRQVARYRAQVSALKPAKLKDRPRVSRGASVSPLAYCS